MISVAKEKSLGWPFEQCYFCMKGTQYWSTQKDIPVCLICAGFKNEWNLPDKEVWALGSKKKKTKTSTL